MSVEPLVGDTEEDATHCMCRVVIACRNVNDCILSCKKKTFG